MTEKEKAQVQVNVERAFRQGYTKALIEEGRPLSEIASRLGIHVSTVRAWKKKLGL